jgi:tRNA-Thr(GGU) m(6)t(6)A37 methyltransferase TsaA
MDIQPIATFHSPFASKFGIPKQSGIIQELSGEIVFCPDYRDPDALRGIEGFDYIWLIWGFSANRHAATSLLVRPPRLGGNKKVGVFASRSPFRPNGLGLSSVRIDRIEWKSEQGPVIHVLGADLMDGTPIYDIKPYITFADSHPDVRNGFVEEQKWKKLQVSLPTECKDRLLKNAYWTEDTIRQLCEVLAEDPRPQYQNDPEKVYGMLFAGIDIHFRVIDDRVELV